MIVRGGSEFAATSILEVLTACVNYGAVVTLAAEGPDADEALDGLASLLRNLGDREEEN